MQAGPMTAQPRVPLSCNRSERISSGDSVGDWQRSGWKIEENSGFCCCYCCLFVF